MIYNSCALLDNVGVSQNLCYGVKFCSEFTDKIAITFLFRIFRKHKRKESVANCSKFLKYGL